MRIPTIPPNQKQLFQQIAEGNPEKLIEIMSKCGLTDHKDRYLHWDQLKYKIPPDGLSVEEYWFGTKIQRITIKKLLPFVNKDDIPFSFGMPDPVFRLLHEIDQKTSGQITVSEPIANDTTRDTYLINSLIEEAINSSQLEGASTTRRVAKNMIRQNRKPRNHSEQMILNNYEAMQFVREQKNEALTPEFIYELHRIVTDKTLEDAQFSGKLRTGDDEIQIIDTQGNVLFIPPNADELPKRIEKICDFANQTIDAHPFVHPVIKSILLHFMLAYDHPFVDGNGRTARALFYWFMAKQGYWLIEFISISHVIKQAHGKYSRSFLYTETDDNDTTYFIIHQLEVIQTAIERLQAYLKKKMRDLKLATQLIEKTRLNGILNYRQLALLENALKNPSKTYTIREHQNTHGIAYQTARTDLMKMSDKFGLFIKLKDGQSFVFLSPTDLRERIEALKNG